MCFSAYKTYDLTLHVEYILKVSFIVLVGRPFKKQSQLFPLAYNPCSDQIMVLPSPHENKYVKPSFSLTA